MSATIARPADAVQAVEVFRVACSGPGDVEAVRALIAAGELVPEEIVAVMGKTEGNGCVNDFTRDFATQAWCHLLAPHLRCTPAQVAERVALVMSGGTEGVLSPHFTVFTRRWVPASQAQPDKGLVLGIAHTRDFLPQELGRSAQIEATAEAVRAAMAEGGIASIEDVHFVQVKCPLLSASQIAAALAAGASPVTRDTYESMAYSRGASSLGVALALGEVTPQAIHDDVVLDDWSLHSARASASAGIELAGNVVIVLGESKASASRLRIGHCVMRDAIDGASVRRLLRERFALDPDNHPEGIGQRLVNLLAKAEASPDGVVRGARHTMLNDSDINATRHARAAVGGVLASIAGHTAIYVSGGAEHQGPAGGGPVCAIVRMPA